MNPPFDSKHLRAYEIELGAGDNGSRVASEC